MKTGNRLHKWKSSGLETIKRNFGGWFSDISIFACGVMLSYIVFVSVFGPLYSVRELFTLGSIGLSDPFPLMSLLLRFSFISYFAVPLGYSFMILRRGKKKGNIWASCVSALIIIISGLGVAKFARVDSIVLTLLCFMSFLILMMMERDETPYRNQKSARNFLGVLSMLYSVYVIALFMLLSPSLDVSNFTELTSFMWTFSTIQAISIPLALITTPIVIGVEHKKKPTTIWVSFVSSLLLLFVMCYVGFYVEAIFFAGLSVLLFYSYAQEKLDFMEEQAGGKAHMRGLKKEELANPQSQGPNTFVLDQIAKPLKALAREVELIREVRTGEVLRVKKVDSFLPSIRRTIDLDGITMDVGVKHFLVSSRTGHGKTTLMKNFMETYKDMAFFVIDRHSEYDGDHISLDKVVNIDDLEHILKQMPGQGLTADRSILREAQVFSLEQQFDRVLTEILPEEFVDDVAQSLFHGQNVVIQPGEVPSMIYNRLVNSIIRQFFEKKISSKARQAVVIVNEEAQNSFEVTQEGWERDRAHPLLKVVLEGRKYNVSLVNVTSDPDNVPKNIKDNSYLILGSIGTPAIKRMVGEKLGMIYIRYIYELPTGYFFLDEPDSDGQYIVFPNIAGMDTNHFSEVPRVLAS